MYQLLKHASQIIPQALCSKYGLAIGANLIWMVRILMVICFPVAYPVGKVSFVLPDDGNCPEIIWPRNFSFQRHKTNDLLMCHALLLCSAVGYVTWSQKCWFVPKSSAKGTCVHSWGKGESNILYIAMSRHLKAKGDLWSFVLGRERRWAYTWWNYNN